jgi:hypothetical protein
LLLLELALALHGQRSILHMEIDVLHFNLGDIGFQHELMLSLKNVHGG